jgi:hypothetical protein
MTNKNPRIVASALFIAIVLMSFSASASLVGDIVSPMTQTICKIFSVMQNIAGGLAALVITIAGFKWVGSAEDPGARKQAKDTIVHALIGMLIITISTNLVALITGSSGC